jgi:membrane complex biogenesis BtpA family protein
MSTLDLRTKPLLIGVAHLLPLPGAPRYGGDLEAVVSRAVSDARRLADGGMHAVIVENFGDSPFYGSDVPKETVAAMTRVAREVVSAVPLPIGVNVLRNDPLAALAVAGASGAAFIRVNVHVGAKWTDQGLVVGRAAETLRFRQAMCPTVKILADVAVKHASPVTPRPIEDEAEDCFLRGHADALVVTGRATGAAIDGDSLARVRERVPGAPLLAGSGVTATSARSVFEHADGAIVGTTLKVDGAVLDAVDVERVRSLVAAATNRDVR